MNYFLKSNKTLFTCSLVVLTLIPLFGIHFFFNLLSNVLIIFSLIPILLLLVVFVGFNYFKSKIYVCDSCGSISLGLNNTCMSCGAELENISKKNHLDLNPEERTIEVEAEEIK